ncbi:MAG: hypothetical protein Q8O89_03220 [Nanoarchaeota archaeon]|nr:hypothetical protein [Nanoarchaeota archaeon]
MEFYVFSNCLGVFVFDESFKVVDKTDISPKDFDAISKSKWIETEKNFLEKLAKQKDSKIFFAGFKSEKIENVEITYESDKLTNILKHFKSREFFTKFYDVNLLQTKLKVKESVKEDLLLIQSIHNIEELDKAANILSKRLREWYELYNPEFSRSIADHRLFVRNVIANTKEDLLKKINLPKEKSMGADLANDDYAPIKSLATEIETLFTLRDTQVVYVEQLTEKYCPNLKIEAGALIAAKLISLAGSFKKLAQLPSSTIQLLGAEKALFRHMKTGAKPPKYGILMQHPAVANAEKAEKGKAARHLAQKIAVGARRDYFGKLENR